MMAELTGMDISNASMYDGTTAAAEAVMMAVAAGKKQDTVLISETVDPKTLRVIETYAHFHGIQIEMIRQKEGITDLPHLQSLLSLHQERLPVCSCNSLTTTVSLRTTAVTLMLSMPGRDSLS